LGTTTTYTESELVSLLKSRDNKAFSYLYDNYAGALYTVICQVIDDIDSANDVLQEVFVNIWRRIETYDPMKGRLFTWMMNIARNAAIDLVRSRSYQNSLRNESLDVNTESRVAGVLASMNVDHIGFKKVIDRLKREHRVLIDLAYFKGYTHEEIAEIEDIPLGTVKTRIRNALIQLREYLK
jgi:RNA polymerase sigma factor (sigma-70 family)